VLLVQVCSNIHIRECKCVYTRSSVELNNQRICRRCRFSLLFSALIFSLSLSLSLLYLSLLFLSFSLSLALFFQVAFTTILKRTNRSENYYHDELFIEVVQSLSSHATRRTMALSSIIGLCHQYDLALNGRLTRCMRIRVRSC
jgi:Mn2+/Fe2+ NRAMP family transporter